MKKLAIRLLLTINAATNSGCCSPLEHEIEKVKNMDENMLKTKVEQLQNILRLVTTLPRLSFPPDNDWVSFVRGVIDEKRRKRAV